MSMLKAAATIRRCAIYGRVSDDGATSGEHNFLSLETQEQMGIASAKRLEEATGIPHVVTHTLIEEKAISGGTVDRPKYQELLGLVRARRIDAVLSKEISRLNRSTRDFCDFMELCKDNNVAVQIKGLDVDPNTPMGRAMFQMLAVVAELEREMNAERTRSSIRSSMLNSAKINGGNVVLGFDRHPEKKGVWIPNSDEMKNVIFLMQTFRDVLSYKETLDKARKLGIRNKQDTNLTKESLKRILTNVKYIGKLHVPTSDRQERTVDLPFGSLVPGELFEEVQRGVNQIEARLKNMNRRGKRIYPLTGLLEYEDGSSFRGLSGTGRDGGKYCYYRNEKNNFSLDAPAIEQAVVDALRIYENDQRMIECVGEVRKRHSSMIDVVRQQVADLQRQLKDVQRDEDGLGDEIRNAGSKRIAEWLDKRLAEIEGKRSSLQRTLLELEAELAALSGKSIDARSLKSSLKIIFDRLTAAEPEVQRGIFRQLFKRIVVFKSNKVQVTWAIPTLEGSGNLFFPKCGWLLRQDSNLRPGD